jgi:DNA-binding CsgD family transcriptional regulator
MAALRERSATIGCIPPRRASTPFLHPSGGGVTSPIWGSRIFPCDYHASAELYLVGRYYVGHRGTPAAAVRRARPPQGLELRSDSRAPTLIGRFRRLYLLRGCSSMFAPLGGNPVGGDTESAAAAQRRSMIRESGVSRRAIPVRYSLCPIGADTQTVWHLAALPSGSRSEGDPAARCCPPLLCESAWRHMARELRLSPREVDVARALFVGDGEKEIATRLGLGLRTAHTHLEHLHAKLGVQTRTQLLVRLFQALMTALGARPACTTGVSRPGGIGCLADYPTCGGRSIVHGPAGRLR